MIPFVFPLGHVLLPVCDTARQEFLHDDNLRGAVRDHQPLWTRTPALRAQRGHDQRLQRFRAPQEGSEGRLHRHRHLQVDVVPHRVGGCAR